MPAVAGLTPKPFTGKGERAKRFSRRTYVLAACLGLVLFGPMASRGDLEEWGAELLTHFVVQMVEYGVNTGLNQINDANGVAGVFMGLLGDTTTGQLDKISSQVTVAQNMIAGLQSDLDNFEGKVDADDNFLALQAAQENFYQDYKAVNAHIQALTNLMNLYGSSGKCGSGVRIL